MSMSIETEGSHEKAMRMCQLLKEYDKKIESLGERLNEIGRELADMPNQSKQHAKLIRYKKSEFLALKDQFLSQQKSINQFVRYCSQQIEHADYSDLDRYEIQMRLSEIESALTKTKALIQSCSP